MDASAPEAARAVAARLARLPAGYSEAVLEALDELEAPDDLDDEVWGPSPDPEYLAAVARNHARFEIHRQRILDGSLTRPEAAARLHVSPQQVSKLVDARELVALGRGGELRLPSWQFHTDTPRGRLEGLADVQAVFPGGPVSLTQWMTRPNPALGGDTPVAALVAGKLARVRAAAEARV